MAAQEARLLHELLASHAAEPDPLAGLAPAFFAEPTSLIETPWAMAATPDFGAPQDGGPAAREWSGTDGSNPVPSSGESANFWFLRYRAPSAPFDPTSDLQMVLGHAHVRASIISAPS